LFVCFFGDYYYLNLFVHYRSFKFLYHFTSIFVGCTYLKIYLFLLDLLIHYIVLFSAHFIHFYTNFYYFICFWVWLVLVFLRAWETLINLFTWNLSDFLNVGTHIYKLFILGLCSLYPSVSSRVCFNFYWILGVKFFFMISSMTHWSFTSVWLILMCLNGFYSFSCYQFLFFIPLCCFRIQKIISIFCICKDLHVVLNVISFGGCWSTVLFSSEISLLTFLVLMFCLLMRMGYWGHSYCCTWNYLSLHVQ
jgi:hypothetical protein